MLAIIALIAPIITTVINNKHTYKMEKLQIKQNSLDFSNKHIRQCFEEFLSAYGSFIGKTTYENEAILKSSFYKCLPYVPPKKMDAFFEFYENLANDDLKSCKQNMQTKLIYSIRDILEKL
ncbi:hypothetical protein ACYSNW_04590 [Enterococcus sp. LJL99]